MTARHGNDAPDAGWTHLFIGGKVYELVNGTWTEVAEGQPVIRISPDGSGELLAVDENDTIMEETP